LTAVLMLAWCAGLAPAQEIQSDRQLRQRAGYAITRIDGAIVDLEALRAHISTLRTALDARITADSLAAVTPAPPVVEPTPEPEPQPEPDPPAPPIGVTPAIVEEFDYANTASFISDP